MVMNVPGASHMGGVWERQIRTVKNVLVALLKHTNSRLDSSSLRTFFYEAMAIVNSRPLAIENLNDPCGPEALMPNHLLTMKSKILMPLPGKFETEDIYSKKRWRRVQYLADQFWIRWKKEYMANLQVRQKWNTTHRNVQIGDIVLLKDEDLVRYRWNLAKVVETMPSQDNLVRKVKLLMSDATLTKKGKRIKKASYLERPIHKLAMLLESNDDMWNPAIQHCTARWQGVLFQCKIHIRYNVDLGGCVMNLKTDSGELRWIYSKNIILFTKKSPFLGCTCSVTQHLS